MSLQNAINDPRRADRAGAILLLVGIINIPIIYFSVEWWNTLHQGSSIKLNDQTSMDETMLLTLLVMTTGFWAYSIAMALGRVQQIILQREQHTTWVRNQLRDENHSSCA
jgi:heme exporter protein C